MAASHEEHYRGDQGHPQRRLILWARYDRHPSVDRTFGRGTIVTPAWTEPLGAATTVTPGFELASGYVFVISAAALRFVYDEINGWESELVRARQAHFA